MTSVGCRIFDCGLEWLISAVNSSGASDSAVTYRRGQMFCLVALLIAGPACYFAGRYLGISMSERLNVLEWRGFYRQMETFLALSPIIIVIALGAYLFRSRTIFINILLLTTIAVAATPYPTTRRGWSTVEAMLPRAIFVGAVCVIFSFAFVLLAHYGTKVKRLQFSTFHSILFLTIICSVLAMWVMTSQ